MTVETTQASTEIVQPERTLKARAADLFPQDEAGRIGRRRIVLSVAFVVLATVASLARQNGPGALNSIWAEDGITFYQATFHQDLFHVLFAPNNGYLQLLPRLVVPLVALFPISWAAGLIAAAGALISSACALLVYHASAALVPSRVARLCFVLPMALVLYGYSQVGNNLVDGQWYLISTAFWMMLWNPRIPVRRALVALMLFLAISTDPLTLMFLPLLALRLWSRPVRESVWQLGGVAGGVLLQGIEFLHGALATRPPTDDYSIPFALRGYVRYVSGTTLVSTRELSHLGLSQPIAAQVIGILAVLVIAVAALLLANRSTNRLLAAICMAFSLVFFSVTTMRGGFYSDRYSVPPALLLITTLAVLSSPADARSTAARTRSRMRTLPRSTLLASTPLVALCVLVACNLAANYYGGSADRATAPSWSSQVAKGRAECRVAGTTTARLQTAPGGGWFVTAPCSRLLN